MSNLRQQRAVRNRRLTTLSAPPAIPALAMRIASTESSNVLLRAGLYSQPPEATSAPVPMQINGIPQILRVDTGEYPVNAVLTDNETELVLFYSAPAIDPGESFVIGPQDPAVRTAQGGFMAPGNLGILPPDAPTVPYTAVADGSPVVVCTLGVPSFGHDILYAPRSFTTGAGGVNSATDDGVHLTLTFSANINPGDVITYTGAQVTGNGNTVATPTPNPVTTTA